MNTTSLVINIYTAFYTNYPWLLKNVLLISACQLLPNSIPLNLKKRGIDIQLLC